MKSLLIKKTTLTVCLIMTIYYVIMELYYYYYICETYSRFGFNININHIKYIETKILFVIVLGISIFVSKRSGFIYSIFIFFVIFFLVPTLITYSFSDQISVPLYSTITLLVALGTISVSRIRLPNIRSASISFGAVMFFVFLSLIPILFTFGVYFNPRNLLLDEVYNTRDYFDENANAGVNYLYNWLIKAFVPVCLVFFLIHKRYIYVLLSLTILLYLYVISGNKLVYITSFVMLFFFFSGSDYFQKTKVISIALVLGLVLAPLIDYYVFQNDTLKGAFVMRMLFLPSYMNYFYIDFFTGHPLFFSESHFFRMFSEYPFDRPIGYIIAENYIHVTDMNANNGFIGDGFMNLGYLGIALNILIISSIFLYFNSVNVDSRYLGIFFLMVFLFLSVPLLSMFITSGLWILFLMSLTFMKADMSIAEK